MLQRNTLSISRLRVFVRPLTPFLYFFLIVSLSWYEASFSFSASAASTNIAAEQINDNGKVAMRQGSTARRLPSLRAPVPRVPSGTQLRSEHWDDDFYPLHLCGAVIDIPLLLPSLRIDPVLWERRTPSFLLPSAYGLVPFAIPPPLFRA